MHEKGYVGSSWEQQQRLPVKVPGPVFLKVGFATQDYCLGVKKGWSSYVRTADTSSQS